jgi:hypothetical protein
MTAASPRDERIDVRDRDSVERWTKALSVSLEQLAAVVAIAGDRADDVRDYLEKNGPPATVE